MTDVTTPRVSVDRVVPGFPGIIANPTIQYERPIGPRNDVLTKTRHFIERFIAFNDPNHSLAIALWVLHTHTFDGAYTTPYMYVTSTEPGCGKTTLLEAAYELARTPVMAGGVSASSLFRMIGGSEGGAPALFIDEVDTIYSGSKNDDLRQVLNTGYKHNGSILRTIDGESQAFSTFAPKMLGGIDNAALPSTVRDRCITIMLTKVRKDKLNVERFLMRKVEAAASALKDEIREWATLGTIDKIGNLDVAPIDGISDRQWDISEPLIQVATVLGYAREAREALTAIFAGQKELTPEAEILIAARDLFEQTGADRITNGMMADATGYTPERISRMLSPLGIKSRPIRVGGNTVRGYYRPEFESAWERYL